MSETENSNENKINRKSKKLLKKSKTKLWIKNRTFLNEFTVDEYLRKEVKLIVAKYSKQTKKS
ncbi:hypothetical protein SB775_07075 [Peribacillus sp. SIMBA_075]|uniref:hypothetical protein n=1 Tax=Peribacillus sp. SIMBA_075 TaxID=3085813 RepID=UPI00397C2126